MHIFVGMQMELMCKQKYHVLTKSHSENTVIFLTKQVKARSHTRHLKVAVSVFPEYDLVCTWLFLCA